MQQTLQYSVTVCHDLHRHSNMKRPAVLQIIYLHLMLSDNCQVIFTDKFVRHKVQ